ncbi:unnamed protein product [Lampetra planeri]
MCGVGREARAEQRGRVTDGTPRVRRRLAERAQDEHREVTAVAPVEGDRLFVRRRRRRGMDAPNRLEPQDDGRGDSAERFLLGADVGTTTLRCHVYDASARIRGSASSEIKLLYPSTGAVELDPDALFCQFVDVTRRAMADAGVEAAQVLGLGISTQRATFTTWHRQTGKPFHNFISWQDLRASELVESWNRSFTLQSMHGLFKLLHSVSRHKRLKAASVINFSTQHVTMRLMWVLQNIPAVQEASQEGNCCLGTIDTWLLYRLTGGQVYATDYSNASSTGIFDPYQMAWSTFLMGLVSLPGNIFPPVEDTSKLYGHTEEALFGAPIAITALVADQQAAMFGECCFEPGDVKLTMGTGTFVNINTGERPHASVAGLYPVVGWKIREELVFLAEGNAADTGTSLKWAQELGLFQDVSEIAVLAQSVPDSGGVYFVPAFSGLQAPLNDPNACTALVGLKPSTSRAHIVRAVVEALVFRNKQLHNTMLQETRLPMKQIRADGGVCNNDFVLQLTADLLGCSVDRPQHTDMSSLGAAFLAGLAVGFWNDRSELKALRWTEKLFEPRTPKPQLLSDMRSWERALKLTRGWYSKS